MFRTVRMLLVFVAALGLFAERAAAQIPATDGTFYACVRIDRDGDEGKLARLVAANEPCRRNETRVHWSQAGPQGPRGTNGTNGVPGINGTNGKDGVPGVNGTNGTDGRDGHDGKDGTNGTRAAGPCFDGTNRYVNCLNGTVTDTVTGLIWLQDAACLGNADWVTATGAAGSLANGQCGLTDNSSPGDWRLPTQAEWIATINQAVALGCALASGPTLTNDAGAACLSTGFSSLVGVASADYWSSSTNGDFPGVYWGADHAWGARLAFGIVLSGFVKVGGVGNRLWVWPVRSGPR